MRDPNAAYWIERCREELNGTTAPVLPPDPEPVLQTPNEDQFGTHDVEHHATLLDDETSEEQ